MLAGIAGGPLQDEDGNWKIPTEVLLNILRLVPNRENLKLTCKKFYSLTCSIESNRKLLINNVKVGILKRVFSPFNIQSVYL